MHYTIKTKKQTVPCPQKGYYVLLEKRLLGTIWGQFGGFPLHPGWKCDRLKTLLDTHDAKHSTFQVCSWKTSQMIHLPL